MENQNYSHVDAQNDGLTFRDILNFLKKCLPTLVVCILICCIVVGLVGVIMSISYKNSDVAYGAVAFKYDAISEGKNPDDSIFDAQSLRSLSVIETALANLGLDDDYDAQDVRAAISVDSIVSQAYQDMLKEFKNSGALTSDQIDSISFNPTSFSLALDSSIFKKFDVPMSGEDAKRILNEIMTVYINAFAQKYQNISTPTFNVMSESDINTTDFVESALVLKSQINSIEEYIDQLASSTVISTVTDKDGNVTTTSQQSAIASSSRLKELQGNLTSVKQSLSSTISFIKSNTIARDKTSSVDYINYTISELTKEKDAYDAEIAALNTAITNYSAGKYPTTNVTNGTANINIPNSSAYDTLISRLQFCTKQSSNIDSDVILLTEWSSELSSASISTEAQIASANARLVETATATNNMLSKTSVLVDNYNLVSVSNLAQISSSAVLVNFSGEIPWLKMFVIAAVIGLLLGFIMQPIIIKVKKNKALRPAKANNDDADND